MSTKFPKAPSPLPCPECGELIRQVVIMWNQAPWVEHRDRSRPDCTLLVEQVNNLRAGYAAQQRAAWAAEL